MLAQKLPLWLWKSWYYTYGEFIIFLNIFFLFTRRQSVYFEIKDKWGKRKCSIMLEWYISGEKQARSGFQTSKSVLCGV